jgi:hypothetical protein
LVKGPVKASTKLKPLEPVDHERCQADIKSAYNPFILGGDVGGKWGRCKNKPTWYAREVEVDADGRRGAMSLCDECKVECEKRVKRAISFEPLVGWNEKFHQLYENPNIVPREEVQRTLRDAGADPETASAFEQLVLERWRAAGRHS